ncbi:hypothetical protein M514_26121 [Trichuris suis]|uniref:Uncharacterized protein n=1 Tax=Trichuris suis TaxID=68888 RepID=A0A085MWX4_9BILA|nr:hypothetical protein M514_26121 [Trichuris suis]
MNHVERLGNPTANTNREIRSTTSDRSIFSRTSKPSSHCLFEEEDKQENAPGGSKSILNMYNTARSRQLKIPY